MVLSSLDVIRVASQINQMTNEEMRTMADFLFPLTAEKLGNYISFSLQEKDLLDIEVQDPVC
jgi:hypothetical protein